MAKTTAGKSLKPCIEFKGHINTGGYGVFYIGNKQRLAHVVSFKLNNPSVIIGKRCVCHKCDNKICVNPDHLFLGTRIDNNLDRDKKDRQVSVYGEENGMSKLKELDVLRIKSLLNNNLGSLAEIGRQFGVRWQTIQAIKKGITWKNT